MDFVLSIQLTAMDFLILSRCIGVANFLVTSSKSSSFYILSSGVREMALVVIAVDPAGVDQ